MRAKGADSHPALLVLAARGAGSGSAHSGHETPALHVRGGFWRERGGTKSWVRPTYVNLNKEGLMKGLGISEEDALFWLMDVNAEALRRVLEMMLPDASKTSTHSEQGQGTLASGGIRHDGDAAATSPADAIEREPLSSGFESGMCTTNAGPLRLRVGNTASPQPSTEDGIPRWRWQLFAEPLDSLRALAR